MKVLIFTSLAVLCSGWGTKATDYSKCIVGSWEGTMPIRISTNGEKSTYKVDFILHLRSDNTIEFEFDDLLAQIAWYTYYQYEVNMYGANYKVVQTKSNNTFNIELYADTDLGNFQSSVVFSFINCNNIKASYTDKKDKEGTLQLIRQ